MLTFYLNQNGRTHLDFFYKQIWEEEKWKKSGRKANIKAKEKAMNFSSFTLDFQNSLSIVQYWKSSIQTTANLQQVSQLPNRKRNKLFWLTTALACCIARNHKEIWSINFWNPKFSIDIV